MAGVPLVPERSPGRTSVRRAPEKQVRDVAARDAVLAAFTRQFADPAFVVYVRTTEGVEVSTSGGRIDVNAAGNVLIPELNNNKIVERDLDGKVVRETAVPQPITATESPRPTLPVLIAAPRPAITPQPSRPATSGAAAGSTLVH